MPSTELCQATPKLPTCVGMASPFTSIGDYIWEAGVLRGEAFVSHDIISANSYYEDAQDHLPLAYGIVRGFASAEEVARLDRWFSSRECSELKRTLFDGEDLADGKEGDIDEPMVTQLYRNPLPFEKHFPEIYERILKAKTAFGLKVGMSQSELDGVNFGSDIRFVTYREGNSCPWHRDDPTSHFNTIIMVSQPGEDFEGGVLQFYPTNDPTSIVLSKGDAVIYSTPKVDHRVTAVSNGVRKIFLLELKHDNFRNIKPL